MSNKHEAPQAPDWDDCYSMCTEDGEDSVYIGVEKDEGGGWWLFVSIDCNTRRFCEDYGPPQGPFEHYTDAVADGVNAASQWFSDNECMPEDWDEQVSGLLDAAGMDEAWMRGQA